jgi:hypothetical protein
LVIGSSKDMGSNTIRDMRYEIRDMSITSRPQNFCSKIQKQKNKK